MFLSNSQSRHNSLGGLGVVLFAVASTILGRVYTARTRGALSLDAQLFAYIGQGWAHGLVLYRDLWDHKPPGIFAVDAVLLYIWPNSFTAIAGMEFCMILGAIYLAYCLAREVNARPGITACIVAITCNIAFYNEGGNLTETFLILPEMASAYTYVLFLRTGKVRYAFAVGLFSGVAALFKPVGLAPLLAAVAYSSFECAMTRRGSRLLIRAVALMCAGAAFSWLPFAAYFCKLGLLHEMFFASLIYNFRYADFGLRGIHKLQVLVFLEPVLVLVVALFALALMFAVSYRERRATTWGFLLLWAGADIAGAVAGGRYFPHYLLPTMASLSICLGVVLSELVRHQQRWGAVIITFALAPLVLIQAQDLAHLRTTKVHGEFEQIAWDINHDKTGKSTLFCWDYLPGIYLDTGLRSPTRHLFAFRMAYNKQHADEIMGAIEHTPASYLVFRRTGNIDARFADLLARKYSRWKEEGDLEVWKLK